jgi:hypothetical protein
LEQRGHIVMLWLSVAVGRGRWRGAKADSLPDLAAATVLWKSGLIDRRGMSNGVVLPSKISIANR